MRSRVWHVAHTVLPWSVLRRICDLCAEFPDDPKRMAGLFDTPVQPDHPVGWSCRHMTITASCIVGRPTVGCGCTMLPIYGRERA